jgi:hypothetical protein
LGIGANTAIFSVVNAVLLRPLPYPAAERLVQAWRIGSQGRRHQRHLGELPALAQRKPQLRRDGRLPHRASHPDRPRRASVHARGRGHHGFFGLVGAHPLLGRVFGAADDQPGAAPTVVLDYRFWTSKAGSRSSVVGASLALDGKPYEVIGVLPPGLRFFRQSIDFYLPLHQFEGEIVDRAGTDPCGCWPA